MIHLREEFLVAASENPKSVATQPPREVCKAMLDIQLVSVGVPSPDYYAGLSSRRPLSARLDLPPRVSRRPMMARVSSALGTADALSKTVISLLVLLLAILTAVDGWSLEPLKGLR
jgi:hypothetical protein